MWWKQEAELGAKGGNVFRNIFKIFESLFALDHDDVVAELGLDRGVGVHGFGQA